MPQLTALAEGRKYEAALAWINAGTRLHIVHPLWLADCVRSGISPCARFGARERVRGSVWAALAGSFGLIVFAAFALMTSGTGRCQCVRCPKQGAPLPCQLVRNECTSQPPRLLVTRRFCSDHAALAAPDVP